MEMRNKRKMIIIGGAAFALIVAASVTGLLIYNNSVKAEEFDDGIGVGTELGIHYGGEFDEFADISEDDESGDMPEENQVENAFIEKLERGDFEVSESGKADLMKILDEHQKELDEADFGKKDEDSRENAVLYNDVDSLQEGTNAETSGTEKMGDSMIETDGYAEHEVICDAGSREEAESIASQISGTLLSWDYGVATIQIEGSVDELLNQLEQQGSNLLLYRNYNYKMK